MIELVSILITHIAQLNVNGCSLSLFEPLLYLIGVNASLIMSLGVRYKTLEHLIGLTCTKRIDLWAYILACMNKVLFLLQFIIAEIIQLVGSLR